MLIRFDKSPSDTESCHHITFSPHGYCRLSVPWNLDSAIATQEYCMCQLSCKNGLTKFLSLNIYCQIFFTYLYTGFLAFLDLHQLWSWHNSKERKGAGWVYKEGIRLCWVLVLPRSTLSISPLHFLPSPLPALTFPLHSTCPRARAGLWQKTSLCPPHGLTHTPCFWNDIEWYSSLGVACTTLPHGRDAFALPTTWPYHQHEFWKLKIPTELILWVGFKILTLP